MNAAGAPLVVCFVVKLMNLVVEAREREEAATVLRLKSYTIILHLKCSESNHFLIYIIM